MRARITVVLPDPDSPTIVNTLPRSKVKFTSITAGTPWYAMLRFSTVSMFSAIIAPHYFVILLVIQ